MMHFYEFMFIVYVFDTYHLYFTPNPLLYQDTVIVQKLLARWFQKNDCKVFCVGNGKEGLNKLMTTKIDIAVVDFLMVRIWVCL